MSFCCHPRSPQLTAGAEKGQISMARQSLQELHCRSVESTLRYAATVSIRRLWKRVPTSLRTICQPPLFVRALSLEEIASLIHAVLQVVGEGIYLSCRHI
jgi:hypothetical protein